MVSPSMWSIAWNLLLLASLVATNLLAFYSLTLSRQLDRSLMGASAIDGIHKSLLEELTFIREELRRTQRHLIDTSLQIKSQSTLGNEASRDDAGKDVKMGDLYLKSMTKEVPPELREFTTTRVLTLGRNPSYGEETMLSPIGHACYRSLELLDKYMNYTVGQLCPDDTNVAQNLMVRGCEPLPRRRCFSRVPPFHSQPIALPQSLWSKPPDDNVLWTHYTCKSFECLERRAKESNVFTDCADCFDLEGPDKMRWVITRDRFDLMNIEHVLALKRGTIRIGLDLGGGSASFAARMKEQNVTVITSTLNLNGPFNEFVALRGLLPLYTTISQRLPFFDNTLDLVHSMHVLSHWIPPTTLEFIFYDIDRVLRPGGLLWLDHFFCSYDQLMSLFGPMIEGLGYLKHGWATGNKTDSNGLKNREVYLSALLEKPVRESVLGST